MKFNLLLVAAMLWVSACKKEDVPDPAPMPDDGFGAVAARLNISKIAPEHAFQLPSWLLAFQPEMLPDDNRIELGRVIFYDKNLSADGAISCASCHRQEHAFADNTVFSSGISNQPGSRNSMALLNNISFGGFFEIESNGDALVPLFWDSRANSIPEQSRAAFTNPKEMAMTMPAVVEAVRGQDYYPWLFARAFGDTLVSEERILLSIAHFLNTLHTSDSRFDRAIALQVALGGTPDAAAALAGLSAEENEGKALYLAHCHSCHGSLLDKQSIFEANNGLESPYTDKGKGAISGNFYENGTFRIPMLRNIAQSAPYMHDGRFATLEEVIEHYNSGVVKVFGLHGDLLQYDETTQKYNPQRLHLSEEQKAALKAFLLTLSDASALQDIRFRDPFR